jgi:hypothetical protein
MNTPATKIQGTEEAWESGALGADEAHIGLAPDDEHLIDEAMELHPISIRLQKGLLENLKAIAQLNGIGYQPLVRQVLTRFVDCELKDMLASRLAEQEVARAIKTGAQKTPTEHGGKAKQKKAA